MKLREFRVELKKNDDIIAEISSVDCIYRQYDGDMYTNYPQIYSSSHSMTVYVHLKQGDRVFVRLCPNSSEDYKTHSFDIVRNEEGKKVKRPKLKNQIYTGKCSFFSGALVTLNGMDRTEEL